VKRTSSLQSQFQSAILTLGDEFDNEIVATERVGAKQRIGIYADAYRLRLIECLKDSYSALHTLLGDDEFDRLCRSYIDTHTPHHYSVRWYGDRLAEYLGGTAPYCEHPYLAELADFEWNLMEAFDERDVPPVTVEDMAAIPADQWPQLTFALHPSLRRLDLAWNVAAIRNATDEDRDPSAPQQGSQPVPWVIWRRQLRQFYRSLAADEAWMLDQAQGGENFAVLCAGLCRWKNESEVAVHAAGLLKQWINDGLITRIGT
jgi:hypothetical protein